MSENNSQLRPIQTEYDHIWPKCYISTNQVLNYYQTNPDMVNLNSLITH